MTFPKIAAFKTARGDLKQRGSGGPERKAGTEAGVMELPPNLSAEVSLRDFTGCQPGSYKYSSERGNVRLKGMLGQRALESEFHPSRVPGTSRVGAAAA